MSILKVPIQINGQEGTEEVPSKLLPRELYIDKSGYLYYGNSQNQRCGVKVTYANTADTATSADWCKQLGESLEGDAPIFIRSDPSDSTRETLAKFGDIRIRKTVNNWWWIGCLSTSPHTASVERMLVNDCKFTDMQSLTVTDAMYGTEAPEDAITNPTPGQVYFKI